MNRPILLIACLFNVCGFSCSARGEVATVAKGKSPEININDLSNGFEQWSARLRIFDDQLAKRVSLERQRELLAQLYGSYGLPWRPEADSVKTGGLMASPGICDTVTVLDKALLRKRDSMQESKTDYTYDPINDTISISPLAEGWFVVVDSESSIIYSDPRTQYANACIRRIGLRAVQLGKSIRSVLAQGVPNYHPGADSELDIILNVMTWQVVAADFGRYYANLAAQFMLGEQVSVLAEVNKRIETLHSSAQGDSWMSWRLTVKTRLPPAMATRK